MTGQSMIDAEQKSRWLYELSLNGFIILRNFLPLRWMSRDPVSAFIVFMPRVS